MNWFPNFRTFLVFLALGAVSVIVYDDKKYAPFGFRYWLSLLSLIYIGAVHLFVVIFALGATWLLVTRFSFIMLLIWGILLSLVVLNTHLLVKLVKVQLNRTWYYQVLTKKATQTFALNIIPASKQDISQLKDFQQTAFKDLYKKYQDAHSPYLESAEEIREKFQQDNTVYYWIVVHHLKVGFLRIVLFPEEKRIWLSPLVILPEYQRKGFARQAVQMLESLYPEISHWTLATIFQEEGLVRFYQSLGYRLTKMENEQPEMDIVYMEKRKS